MHSIKEMIPDFELNRFIYDNVPRSWLSRIFPAPVLGGSSVDDVWVFYDTFGIHDALDLIDDEKRRNRPRKYRQLMERFDAIMTRYLQSITEARDFPSRFITYALETEHTNRLLRLILDSFCRYGITMYTVRAITDHVSREDQIRLWSHLILTCPDVHHLYRFISPDLKREIVRRLFDRVVGKKELSDDQVEPLLQKLSILYHSMGFSLQKPALDLSMPLSQAYSRILLKQTAEKPFHQTALSAFPGMEFMDDLLRIRNPAKRLELIRRIRKAQQVLRRKKQFNLRKRIHQEYFQPSTDDPRIMSVQSKS